MIKKFNLLTIAFLFLCFSQCATAEDNPPKPDKLFKNHSRLNVTLKGPWRRMTRRVTNPETYPGEITFSDEAGTHTLPLGITTRGLTRRERVCDFPPLKLWFDKEQFKGTVLRGQGSLKMVTHCKTSRGFEQYYIKEYLSYRIYNLITPYSFRVRPMMVTYIDSERNSKPHDRFGFLIEDVDDVAARHDLMELEIPHTSPRNLDPLETSHYALFQYLIANLDWSATGGPDPVECCHNSKLIGTGVDVRPMYSIPYDLDSSGLVDTHYAAPPERLPVRSIRDRLYRGFCFHNNQVPAALARFIEKKQEIMDLFRNDDLLTNKGRENAINFLEGFYRDLSTPEGLHKNIIDKCRG